jgi:hypothetical protein
LVILPARVKSRGSRPKAQRTPVGVVPCSGAGESPVHLVHAVLLVVAVGIDRVRVALASVLGEHDRFDVLEIAEAKILARTLRILGSAVDFAISETVHREVGSVRQFHVVLVVQIDAFVTSEKNIIEKYKSIFFLILIFFKY